MKNSFATDGNLSKIETMPSSGSYATRADNFAYSAHGAIKHLQIGSGKWENANFNSRLQVTQLGLGTSSTDTSLWKLEYDFGTTDNNGNIKTQTTTVPTIDPLVQTFTYDSLDRLKTATETANSSQTWKQTFTYDRYGNRNFDAGNTTTLGSCATAICNPTIDVNTNRFTGGQGYTYDLAGNIIQDPDGRQFTFNGDNKQTEVKDASNNVIGTYHYDGDGKRIKKVSANETTLFVYSGGKLVAEYQLTESTPTTPTTQYLTTDMLESPRVISDQAGNIVSRRDFMPFGEEITGLGGRSSGVGYNPDNIRQKFTGYEKDDETGLDFAEARYYNSKNGRFTAVDPLLTSGKSADPQTFNRYSYTMNNPLVMTDPTGMQAGEDESEIVARVTTSECGGFWCKVKSGFNQFFKVMVGTLNPDQDEEIAIAERKRGGIDKQVKNAINNYTQDIETVTNTVIGADPTGVGNLVKTGVKNSVKQASDAELRNASINAIVNTASTIVPSGSAFKIAKEGGKHAGLLKNYASRSVKEIEKAIKSKQAGKRGLETHLDKIENPSKYVKDWDSRSEAYKQGLIKKWQNEVKNAAEEIDVLRGIIE